MALRPEPFGALAYHYGNRRLVFVRKPELVSVLRGLAAAPTLAAALDTAGVAAARWPAFARAVGDLITSEVVRER